MYSNIYNEGCMSQGRRSTRSSSQSLPSTSYSHSQPLPRQEIKKPNLDSEKSKNGSQEEQQLIGDAVEYILMEDSHKKPITKKKIIKHVFGIHAKEFSKVIPKVKASLQKVFGYKLIEFDSGKYIVVNEVENSSLHIKYSASERLQMVLLFIILAHIFMQDESCTEDVLWDFLKHAGIISENSFHHPYFGNVKELINEEFLAQRYLNKVIYEPGEPPKYEYKWGPRAEHELSRRAVMEFVSEVYNGRSLSSWPLQYKALLDKEKNVNNRH